MWFICRHGETLHNKLKIKQGRYPSLLTLKGIDQIKSIAYRILDYEQDFSNYELISSPMARTRHSMQIIQEVLGITDKKVIEEELITETDAGDFTNVPKSEIIEKFPNFLKDKDINPDLKFPNGESLNDTLKRIREFYDKIKNKDNLIIVTHGRFVKRIAALKAGLDINAFAGTSMNQNYLYVHDENKNTKLI